MSHNYNTETKMKIAPKQNKKAGSTLSTRVSEELFARVNETCDEMSVGPADLVREGLSRVLAEFARNGSIRFAGKRQALLARKSSRRKVA